MTDVLEKIARAIEDAMASDDNHPHDIARAALLAMRDGGFDIYHASDRNSRFPTYEAAEGFADMIDAILAQPSTPTDVTPA